MTDWAAELLAGLHFAALGGIALYGLHRLWLAACWYGGRNVKDEGSAGAGTAADGHVTVQLPLYNERFVAARLIDAVAGIHWPRRSFEIQIIDDSTDDTSGIIDERAAFWRERGTTVSVLRRRGRPGFKAGALAYGLERAAGEYIALFDADFLPPSDFLCRTVPRLAEGGVGMVQARWGFVNAEHSWLTRLQSLLLGHHFSIEHTVRSRRGLFFNFNGTAGIWRRSCIEGAGGWQSDTVTEDLDLSYRAQMAGWRFVYLDDLVVPSELPTTLGAYRSQQMRWAKGSIQTARKILPPLLASPSLSAAVKIEAVFHLLGNLAWLFAAVATLTLLPAIIWRVGIGPWQLLSIDLPLFFGGSCAIMGYFILHALREKRRDLLLWLPLLPVFTIGLAPSLSLAVLRGFFTKGGVFERTPKYGLRGREGLPGTAGLYRQHPSFHLGLNIALLINSFLPLLFAFHRGTWPAVPLLMIFSLGFLIMVLKDIDELPVRAR